MAPTNTIIHQTIRELKTGFAGSIAPLTIVDVHIGMHLSAIELSDGSCGVAGTAENSGAHAPERRERDFGAFTPNQIRGQNVLALLESEKASPVVDTLKIAVLNAISSALLASSSHKIVEDKDPVDLLDLGNSKSVALVGAFRSYMKKIADAGAGIRLQVLEFKKEALPEEFQQHYVPAADYQRVLPASDVVIITGLTLVNGTIDGLLSSIRPGAEVVVTGPSANIIPDVLFDNGVTMIGATRITDRDMLFSTVGEGGSGYHLFRYCARKITIVKGQNNG